jgi:pimeloyl-ACP methyl ester carboxylesterase
MKFLPNSKIARGSLLTLFALSFVAVVTNQLFAQAQNEVRVAADIGPVRRLGELEYVEFNPNLDSESSKQLVVFVHGTPGSFSAFLRYINDPKMRENFHMIAVTRPGWLQDDDEDDERVPSLEAQAAALEPLLRMDTSGKGALLMGHSYGGPVIAKTAMQYSDLISGLVFVASTGDPELSGPRWYNRIAIALPRFILGSSLKGANAEILPLRPQLEAMLPEWENLNMPVLIVQGDKDRLVNPGNANFMEKMLVNSDVTFLHREGQGHFVLWEEADLIVDTILEKFN